MRQLRGPAGDYEVGSGKAATRLAIEFPAMAGADEQVSIDEAIGEQTAVVWAGIWHDHHVSALQLGDRHLGTL